MLEFRTRPFRLTGSIVAIEFGIATIAAGVRVLLGGGPRIPA